MIVVEGAVALPGEALGGASRVRNEAWAQGPLGSVQVGLAAAREACPAAEAIVVVAVDRPHVEASTLRALAAAVDDDAQAIWQPRYQGRRGHPIVYPVDLVARLCALRPPQTPRTLLAEPQVAARRRQIDVDDAAVLDNLDRPEDLARLPD